MTVIAFYRRSGANWLDLPDETAVEGIDSGMCAFPESFRNAGQLDEPAEPSRYQEGILRARKAL